MSTQGYANYTALALADDKNPRRVISAVRELQTAAGKVVYYDTNGDVLLGGNLSVLTGDLTVNGRVVFPATQNFATDVNTLDDYEEGTWTPALNINGTTTGITYTTQVGAYVKVGKIVTIEANVLVSSNGSSTGSATITGLPFTSNGTSKATINMVPTAVIDVDGLQSSGEVTTSSKTVSLFFASSSGGRAAFTDTTIPDASGFNLSGFYIASQ